MLATFAAGIILGSKACSLTFGIITYNIMQKLSNPNPWEPELSEVSMIQEPEGKGILCLFRISNRQLVVEFTVALSRISQGLKF